MITVYRYDENTKEYLCPDIAQEDSYQGYLLPANCTIKKVPTYTEGTIPVYENDSWVIKTDNRGGIQVNLDDITFSEVDYIGDVREGYQFVTQEIVDNYFEDTDRYKVIDGVFTDIIGTPEYEEIKRQKEIERVGNLTCTKRVFALILQDMGISYAQLKELIATSDSAQLEWDLCVELQRKNPLLDIMAAELGFTSEDLDNIFKKANGEIE